MPDSTGGRFGFLEAIAPTWSVFLIMNDRYFSPHIQGNRAHFLRTNCQTSGRDMEIFMDVHGCFMDVLDSNPG